MVLLSRSAKPSPAPATAHDPQAMYRAHIAYGEEHPEWMKLALSAINRWGKGVTLAQSVAEYIKAAYERGAEGLSPPEPMPGIIIPTPAVLFEAEEEPAPRPRTLLRRRS